MKRDEFNELVARIIIVFVIGLILFTVLGIWLRLFWYGWVTAG
mgnify:CR=1 FL=1